MKHVTNRVLSFVSMRSMRNQFINNYAIIFYEYLLIPVEDKILYNNMLCKYA